MGELGEWWRESGDGRVVRKCGGGRVVVGGREVGGERVVVLGH